jgi:hypothetical protein
MGEGLKITETWQVVVRGVFWEVMSELKFEGWVDRQRMTDFHRFLHSAKSQK